MKILILEDREDRCIQFREAFSGIDICFTDEAHVAIDRLQTEKWDVLFLDHDLGGQVRVSVTGKNTGSEVARFLEANLEYKPSFIVIHSLNTIASRYMKMALRDALVCPFAWTKISKEDLEHNIGKLKQIAEDQKRSIFG